MFFIAFDPLLTDENCIVITHDFECKIHVILIILF